MHGSAVLNTGPLIALSLINRLDIIQHVFSTALIPQEVHDEFMEGGKTNSGLLAYQKAEWIKIVSLKNDIDPLLKTSLDYGEAAVISLAIETSADTVVLDERKARKIGRTVYGLTVIGTAKIIVEAKRLKLIDNAEAILQEMREKGYWIGDAIIDIAKIQAGE